MTTEHRDSVIGLIQGFEMVAVPSGAIHIGPAQHEGQVEAIRRNSLTISANQLLKLGEGELFDVSRAIRRKFTRLASENRMKIDRMDLEQLKPGSENALLHEQAHLKVDQQLRPELINGTTLNILALTHNGYMKVAMTVMSPIPEVAYTAVEKAQILMAPNLPSELDYHGLFTYMRQLGVSSEEVKQITAIVIAKPKSRGRAEVLKFLENFT